MDDYLFVRELGWIGRTDGAGQAWVRVFACWLSGWLVEGFYDAGDVS